MNSQTLKFGGYLFSGIALLLVSGCGSVSVGRTEYKAPAFAPLLPQKIYVENFSFAPGSLSIRRNADRDFQWTVADRLNRALVQRLRARIAHAEPVAAGVPFRAQNGWLIKGRFIQVEEGARLFRGVVGFGWGGSSMRTVVEVYDLRASGSRRPFLILETNGGSNAMPGLVLGNPFEFRAGLTVDAQRSAREITRGLLEYLTVHNCIDASFSDTPKRPNTW
ncbi:MAG: DUF4410 domain-containing protein [Chthoniobacterales bacterium]